MEEAEILLRNAMEHHGAAVYRLALCRMQSVQDAEDVYQDVFLRLLGQEASAWDGEHLRAWLLRCTVNRCHDLHRFRLRRPVLALADLPETAAEPDSGTCFEVGYAFAKGKTVYGYVSDARSLREKQGERDENDFSVEDFGLPLNLMLSCSARIVEGDFAAALAVCRAEQA